MLPLEDCDARLVVVHEVLGPGLPLRYRYLVPVTCPGGNRQPAALTQQRADKFDYPRHLVCRRDGQFGLVTMCAAGGMAPAIIIERI